jgi:hypothetical protein
MRRPRWCGRSCGWFIVAERLINLPEACQCVAAGGMAGGGAAAAGGAGGAGSGKTYISLVNSIFVSNLYFTLVCST